MAIGASSMATLAPKMTTGTTHRVIRYSQRRGSDLARTRWYQESLEQDYLTGMWYPLAEMVQINGRWLHRDNVDEEDLLQNVGGA